MWKTAPHIIYKLLRTTKKLTEKRKNNYYMYVHNPEDIRRCTSLTQCSTITRFEVDIQVKILRLGTRALFKFCFVWNSTHKMIKHHCNFADAGDIHFIFIVDSQHQSAWGVLSRGERRRRMLCAVWGDLGTTSELLPNVAQHFYRTCYACTMEKGEPRCFYRHTYICMPT